MLGRGFVREGRSTSRRGVIPVCDKKLNFHNDHETLVARGDEILLHTRESFQPPGDSAFHDIDDAFSIATSISEGSATEGGSLGDIQGVGLGLGQIDGISLNQGSLQLHRREEISYDNDDISLDICSVSTSVYFESGVSDVRNVPMGSTDDACKATKGGRDAVESRKCRNSCIPGWITGAHPLLKLVLLFGILLLVCGIVTIAGVNISRSPIGGMGFHSPTRIALTNAPTSAPVVMISSMVPTHSKNHLSHPPKISPS